MEELAAVALLAMVMAVVCVGQATIPEPPKTLLEVKSVVLASEPQAWTPNSSVPAAITLPVVELGKNQPVAGKVRFPLEVAVMV